MAEVYRARGKGADGTDYFYAVKRILPEYTRDPEIKRMFIEESRIAACLVHPAVVRVYDLATAENNEIYIVMEFLEGKDLSEAIEKSEEKKQRLPIWFAIQVAMETLRALHYVTTQATDKNGRILGLIHRDISPHNIFICFDGQVKLTDFGVAKVQESELKTQIGITKGKLGYMSPEQLMGSPLDFRSDLYNVAILLFEQITGRQLFAGASTAEFLQAMVRGVVPPIPPGLQVPPDLESLIRRALDRDRARRPATALEFERELGEIADRYGLTAQAPHVAHQMRELYGKTEPPPQLVKPMTAPQKLKSMMLATVDAAAAAALAGPGWQQSAASPSWAPQPVSRAAPQQASPPQQQQQRRQPSPPDADDSTHNHTPSVVWQQPVSNPAPNPAAGYQSPYARPQTIGPPPATLAPDDDFATVVRPIDDETRPSRQPQQRAPSRPAATLPPEPGLQPRVQLAVSARMRSLPNDASSGQSPGTSEQTNPLLVQPSQSQSQSSSSRRPATVARGNARPLEALPSMPRPSAPPPQQPAASAPVWESPSGLASDMNDKTRIEPIPTARPAPTSPQATPPTSSPPRAPTVQVGGSSVGVRSKRVVPLDDPKG